MNVFGFISLFGGLALFLYGMSMLGTGLERVSGGRLEKTLERLTSNILLSVLLGAVVTAAVQSSSATTVIVVGLVNARILKLRNAIGVIMGANIGTTVTAHILRLTDISSDNLLLLLLKPTTLAPLVSIVGIIMFMAGKKKRMKDIGQILLGFGILFTGMFSMEAAVRPLSELPQFAEMFATFSNPIVGVLVGAIVTAVIQSSSASVGILQALSSTGQVTFASAFPIIMGQNIGTTITPILASIGASKNAKRTAAVHVTFNVIGTGVFLIVIYALQSTIGFKFWDLPIDKGGIANFHTIFNVAVTLLFIPFAGMLEKIACAIVKNDKGDQDDDDAISALDDRFMISPGLAVEHARNSAISMGKKAQENFKCAAAMFTKFDPKQVERLNEIENVVDKLEDRISQYLLRLSERELTEHDSRKVSELLHVIGEFERMADHCVNIMECAQELYENKISFSESAQNEMNTILAAIDEIFDVTIKAYEHNDITSALNIEPLEEVVDMIEETLKARHINRLKRGECTVDAAFPFVETLSNLERISDHCSNVGVSLISGMIDASGLEHHEYIRKLHKGDTKNYAEHYAAFEKKYFSRIR